MKYILNILPERMCQITREWMTIIPLKINVINLYAIACESRKSLRQFSVQSFDFTMVT